MNNTMEIRRLKGLGNLVGEQWNASNGSTMQSLCPVDDSVVFESVEADGSTIDSAIAAARLALGDWAKLDSSKRIEFVQKYAEAIKSNADELAELISAETGKPLWESKTEVGAVVGKSAVSIDAFNQRRNTFSFEMGDFQAVTRFKPYGVMGVLGPFNFPAHLPNGHIVPALLAGNTVVYKPSEQTPAVGQWMIQKWQEIGLAPGVVNLVQGGRDGGIHLANHKQIDGLLFTGSSNAGRALHRAYGEHPEKILALEMGGNNPLIVDEADDLDAAAYITINSAYITAGQRCTCARRLVVVDGPKADAFIDKLITMIGKLRISPFTQTPEPFASTVISGSQGLRLLEEQQGLISQGRKSDHCNEITERKFSAAFTWTRRRDRRRNSKRRRNVRPHPFINSRQGF